MGFLKKELRWQQISTFDVSEFIAFYYALITSSKLLTIDLGKGR